MAAVFSLCHRFVFAKQIRVHGGLRLYRIFFQVGGNATLTGAIGLQAYSAYSCRPTYLPGTQPSNCLSGQCLDAWRGSMWLLTIVGCVCVCDAGQAVLGRRTARLAASHLPEALLRAGADSRGAKGGAIAQPCACVRISSSQKCMK